MKNKLVQTFSGFVDLDGARRQFKLDIFDDVAFVYVSTHLREGDKKYKTLGELMKLLGDEYFSSKERFEKRIGNFVPDKYADLKLGTKELKEVYYNKKGNE
jgi:hypothetical protein